jgi:hypothetical protein
MTLVVLARPANAGTFLLERFKGDFSVWNVNWMGDYSRGSDYSLSGFGGGLQGGIPGSLFGDNRDFGKFVENLFTPWVNSSSGVDVVALILVTNRGNDSDHPTGEGNRFGGGSGPRFDGKPGDGSKYGRGPVDGTPRPGWSNGSNGTGSNGTGGPTSVPEPSSLALLLTAGVAVFAGRGRLTPR